MSEAIFILEKVKEACKKANGYLVFAPNIKGVVFEEGFIQGAKWQQEQSNCELSELLEQRNEMLAMLEELYEDVECWSDISSYGYGNKIEQLIKTLKDE
jgi:hypothetical protein